MQLSESICLDGIESKARWIRDSSANLAFYVRQLPSRPEWDTKAQDMLTQAEHELLAALQRVRDAKAEYSAKPIAA